MKRLLLLELIRKLKAKPSLRRKAIAFVIVGALGIVLVASLTIWAGISAIHYVADKASIAMQSPQAAAHLDSLKTEAKDVSLQPLNCWLKAQSLMAVEPWLARPVWDNLKNLKTACLAAVTPVCEGHDCAQIKELTNTAEGSKI